MPQQANEMLPTHLFPLQEEASRSSLTNEWRELPVTMTWMYRRLDISTLQELTLRRAAGLCLLVFMWVGDEYVQIRVCKTGSKLLVWPGLHVLETEEYGNYKFFPTPFWYVSETSMF